MSNLDRVRQGVQGRTHKENVERWSELITTGNVKGLHRALTGLDRRSIEMREVTPFSGLLSEQERLDALRNIRSPARSDSKKK